MLVNLGVGDIEIKITYGMDVKKEIPWLRDVENLTVACTVKDLRTFLDAYGTRTLMAVSTKARHWLLFCSP